MRPTPGLDAIERMQDEKRWVHHKPSGDVARVIMVIETNLRRRGTGNDESSPLRAVTQYWSLEGELLAEIDLLDIHRRDGGLKQ